MKEVKGFEAYEMVPYVKGTLREAFEGFRTSVKRGISFGIVLFLALSTFSVLSWSVQYLEVSVRNTLRSSAEVHSTAPRRAEVFYRRVPMKPFVSAQVRAQGSLNARDVIRESSYFLNTLDNFGRSLARFGK